MPPKFLKQSRPSHRLTSFLLLLCSACFLNAQARAAGTCSVSNFNPPVTSMAGRVRAVTVADFNGDGRMDVAAANEIASNVSILLGNGAGIYAPAATFRTGSAPKMIEAADFNGDGNLDLVTANGRSSNGEATVLLGDGTGKFPTLKEVSINPVLANQATFVTVADFNKDGKADLVVGFSTTGVAVLLLGDGAGNFPTRTGLNNGSPPVAGAAADFDGDGNLDLAVANQIIGPVASVSIFKGNGAGAFAAPVKFSVGTTPVSLVTGDFNGDGKTDIVTANQFSDNVSLLLGDGAGAFAAATHFGAGGFPTSVATADFNGDGHADLAVSNADVGNVLILQGDGTGQFRAAANYTGGAIAALGVSAKDVNGDGMPDLVVGYEDAQYVATLLNSCGTSPAAVGLQFASAAYGASEGGAREIHVVRTGPLEGAASVNYATSDGTAGASDYVAASGTLSFAEGEFSKRFTVNVTNDNLTEETETVNLTLSNPTGAVLGSQSSAVLSISSFNPPPAVSVSDPSVTEGNGGTTDAVFNVTLSNPSVFVITVGYESADATASAGEDYVGASGTLSFGPGETSKSVSVKVNGDTLGEITETFLLNLKSPSNATLADAQGVGTIRDDDNSCPEPSFGTPVNFATGNSPWEMVPADFNRDGRLDLAVGNYNSGTVSILLGDGAGGFAAAADFPVNVGARSIAAGDFNGDGKLDLAAAGSMFGTQGSVIFGDGNGGFGAPSLYTVGDSATAVAAGDFNGDGRDDIAVTNAGGGSISVLLSNAAGGFAAPTSLAAVGISTTSVTVSDLNADARPDILAVNQNSGNVSVFLNLGGGTFAPAVNLAAGQNPQRVAVSDINGDGALDLAVVNVTSRDISILLGDGAGGFTLAGSVPAGVRPDFVLAADFNGDSLIDLAVNHVANQGDTVPAKASVLFGNGRGGFSPRSDFVPGSGAFALAAGDFNSDGKHDLVISNFFSNNVSLLLNACSFVPSAAKVQFGSPAYSVSESAGKLVFTVVRSGDISAPASVEYATADATATESGDYTGAVGRLTFAAGERSKAVTLFITDDAFVEGAETFNITLGNPAGASLGAPATSTVTISSDDVTSPAANPIDGSTFFVRQHYRDFLNRDPDAPGLAFWISEIESCGADAQCREVKRINVSAAFFLSIEFQQTGYLAYRARAAAFGNFTGEPVPVAREEMLRDMQVLGAGVVVGAEGWEQKLGQNKETYFTQLASSSRFTTHYPQTLTPGQYVDALNANAGGALSRGERDALVAELSAGAKTRAQALRAVAEDADLARAEFNRAFVLMQFFGYLRRDPDSAPDHDFSGYDFWLSKLNEFNGNYIQAELVKAFLSADEYRQRFGQ